MTDTAAQPVLVIEDLAVSFRADEGAARAVDGIGLQVFPGEVLALVGESGSGKSVTSLAVIGLLPSTAHVSGRITLAGESLLDAGEQRMNQIRGKDISMVFQEPMTALNPTMTIGAQIAEVITNHEDCSTTEAHRRVIDLLTRVGIPEPELRAKGYPHELSGGQRQRVVIAIALACEPRLIIADEPTTALDVTIQAEILDLIHQLTVGSSTAFLLVTHNMGVVADVADRVAVMYHGQIVEVGAARDVLQRPEADYTRRLLDAVPRLPSARWEEIEAGPAGPAETARATVSTGSTGAPAPVGPAGDAGRAVVRAPDEGGPDGAEAALRFDHVSIDYRRGGATFRAVHDVSLTVASGEIVGLVGESGSGKSTLGRAALGLVPVAEGSVRLLGNEVRQRLALTRSDKETRSRVGVIFQDPGSSLDPRMTVGAVIAEPLLIHRGPHGAGRRARKARVLDLLDAVELPRDYAHRYPHELSGGQRQRVGLARAIALDPRLLIADEPTSALDVSVQAHVLDALRALQERYRFACLFISHDLAVVHSMADRVAVMLRGEIVEVGPSEDVLTRPRHPYSQRLLAAAPSPDPDEQLRRRTARAVLARSPVTVAADVDEDLVRQHVGPACDTPVTPSEGPTAR
ncbi:ABC transporter ATP-binding protein [Cellulomonas sp. P24]|uniref:ABC transporter ATP-binding protein n=1 Tax=Cellulomonas sp. P24 TaxID=2885206 RepID=UPI00216AB5A9|nr:ABC transporter ATP-binding protein [Cellulomonas sp. P24]MCR6492462.1 ABC transporter ATP-binding protein [Cellulomonas sp. P24]